MKVRVSKASISGPRRSKDEIIRDMFADNGPEIKFTTQKEYEKLVAEYYKKELRKIRSEMSSSIKNAFDVGLSDDCIRRRISAVASYGAFVIEKYDQSYPNLMIEHEFAHFNATIQMSSDMMNRMYFCNFAAAKWILNEVEQAHRFEELEEILPELDQETIYKTTRYTPFYMRGSCDGQFLCKPLTQLTYVLLCRDGKDLWDNNMMNQFILRRKPGGKFVKNDGTRDCLEKVLALIPETRMQKAFAYFEQKMWEYFDLFLSFQSPFLSLYSNEVGSLIEATDRKQEETKKILEAEPTYTSPLGSAMLNAVSKKSVDDFLQGYEETKVAYDRCETLRKQFSNPITKMQYDDDLLGVSGNAIDDFLVEEPYEICFAYFRLLDTGSNLAWLFSLPQAVHQLAICELPWFSKQKYIIDIKKALCDTPDLYSLLSPETYPTTKAERPEAPIEEDVPKSEELGKRLYGSIYENKIRVSDTENNFNLNLSQIIYEKTNVILPKWDNADETNRYFEEMFHEPAEAQTAALLYNMAERIKETERHWNEEIENIQKEKEQIMKSTAKDDLHEIASLQERIRVLEQRLSESERETKEAWDQIEKNKKDVDKDRKELYNLRNLIYNQMMDDETPIQEEIEDILTEALPYTPKLHTVICGGHDSFIKAFKPYFNEVRYIGRNEKSVSKIMIQNSDVVWLQTNAMSHALYDTVTDAAKQFRVPVRYFEHASAVKCAEQLIEADVALSKCL